MPSSTRWSCAAATCSPLPTFLPRCAGRAARPVRRTVGIVPLRDAERELIRRTLRHTNGNQSRAAALLDVERHRLRRRIVRYGLEDLIRAKRD